MFTPVNKFTVDRAKWVHGLNGEQGTLLNDHGCMCVLGFYAKACGLTDGEIKGRVSVPTGAIPWQHNGVTTLNDRGENRHGLAYKEERLINFFKRQGIKLNFKGKPKLAR